MMKRGFTLIEQLGALALSSVFMLAAFGALAALARDYSHDRKYPGANALLARAAQDIQRDLTDARRVLLRDDEIIVCGFNSLNAETLAPDHRPVRVIYRIERDEHSSMLIRRQESLDVLSNRNAWSELVCDGIDHLSLVPLEIAPKGIAAPQNNRPIADVFPANDGREIPAAFELKLISKDHTQAPLNCTLTLR